MKCTTLPTTVLAIAAVFAVASPALANRDPSMGGMYGAGVAMPPRIGQTGAGGQYADGMNLYQYVRSNPVRYVDPQGLWGKETHFDQVKDSMHRRCPAIEDAVAGASQGMDEDGHGAPGIVILGWLTLGLNTLRPDVQQDYDYHFPGAGPPFPGQGVVQQGFANPTVMALFKRVTDKNDPKGCDAAEFGKFLHMLADSYSHGGGVPNAFGHPKDVPIYGLVNAQGKPLKHHFDKDGHLVLDEDPVVGPDGDFQGNWNRSGGWTDTSVDDPIMNWKAWNETIDAMRLAMDQFKANCPCACAGAGKDK